jgi:dTDP-4-amino-4,6-dideoxygalactose transaminase
MGIPLVDLQIQHRQVAAEIEAGFARVMEQGSFILGPDVERFERDFAAYCDVSHCIGVANGTDALELVLRAVGIGAGDEVILPVNTFIATALAVARADAVAVFVDCDEQHGLIDPDAARAAVGPRTKALLPVHLYGQMAPMEPLADLAGERGLVLLEDAAQSQGARQLRRRGRRADRRRRARRADTRARQLRQ